VDPQWRNFFAAALWTGLRKGELCGLLETDVDLPNRLLFVGRSYDSDTTKGGHADAIPIAEPLVPYLEDAIHCAPSAYVFPAPDGSMRSEDSTPQRVLRAALLCAGLGARLPPLQGERRAPRRAAPGFSAPPLRRLRHEAVAARDPSKDALPRRQTAVGTLLLRAKVDAHRVQRILRHASINTTLGTYGHLDVEDLRDAINTLPAGPPLPDLAPHGAPVVRNFEGPGDHDRLLTGPVTPAGAAPLLRQAVVRTGAA